MPRSLQPSDRIVFAGDSITDCGRLGECAPLGCGYVAVIESMLRERYPQGWPLVVNRGISGDRTTDLAQRFELDVLAVRPTIVVFYIGVNDVWRAFDGFADPVDAERFGNEITEMIEALPEGCEFILVEPFLDEPQLGDPFRELLAQHQANLEQIAQERNAALVPLQKIFDEARGNGDLLTTDRVHPTESGHRLIAESIVEGFRSRRS